MKVISYQGQSIFAHAIAWASLSGDVIFIKLLTADCELVRWKFKSPEKAEAFYTEMIRYLVDPNR